MGHDQGTCFSATKQRISGQQHVDRTGLPSGTCYDPNMTPAMTLPYTQAQTFCPEYAWSAEADLLLEPPVLAALASGHLCAEVWHHPSRSLAAMLASQQQAGSRGPGGAGGSGMDTT
jgi:hypothetical protein